jgi:hypothetical protein
MPNCSGNCATVQNQGGGIPPGTGIIFRGGDTWHFGNTSLTPYVGGVWNFNSGKIPQGTSSNPIYIGVDPNWYSGSSWARPILNGDNALCNAGLVNGSTCFQDTTHTYEQYYVSSCSYQNSSSWNSFVSFNWVQYYYFDNFEMVGMCESTSQSGFGWNSYILYESVHGPITITNVYIHGWSHTQFAGPNGNSVCNGTGAVCFDIYAFQGTPYSTGIASGYLAQDVVDGSDSDPVGGGVCDGGLHIAAYSMFRYTSQCIDSDLHTFHDNIYEYFFENGHSNVLEEVGVWNGTTNAIYNNIFRHLETTGGTHGVGIWLGPPVGTTDYLFNNLIYDEGEMELINVGSNNNNIGTQAWFDNTLELDAGNGFGCRATGYTYPLVSTNNHFITDSSSPFASACRSQMTSVTNLRMKHSSARSHGYTASETYAYSPISSASPTVGAGTNEGTKNSAFCSALSTAASSDSTLSDAASACMYDTRYACTYNSTNHTVSCPARTAVARSSNGAWDVGAYAPPSSVVEPRSNLQPTAH